MKDITFVITSCGRFDLLTKTVQSFLHLNSYPIKRYLLIEDSCDETMYAKIKNSVLFKEFDIVYNKEKLGQIKSIDYAYSQVDTDYIFHCEDDRLFTRTGFIEDSLQVIESDPKIFQVRIRSPKYTNRSVDPTLYTVNDVSYYILGDEVDALGNLRTGFSFNPGLRRLSDYHLVGSSYYAIGHEDEFDLMYSKLGFYSTILHKPAVKHIGYGYHILDPKEVHITTKRKIRNSISNFLYKIKVGYVLEFLLKKIRKIL